MKVTPSLKSFVEEEIIPRYRHFDKAHSVSHVQTVIRQSCEIYDMLEKNRKRDAGLFESCGRMSQDMGSNPLDADMIYAIAAYHDLGMVEGRAEHHLASGRILEADDRLSAWFDAGQIRVMKEAVEDHRASAKSEPRSIYGRIVSEADRVIDPDTIIARTILFSREHYPHLSEEEHYERCASHLVEKYGDGGYLKLHFSDTANSRALEELRCLIRDPEALREEYFKFAVHPLEPFVPEGAEYLFLGSFPPPHARWSMEFFYPNFQNDMWRIMGLIFYGDKQHFVVPGERRFDYDRVVEFCREKKLAFYDSAYMVKRLRGNASDLHLKIIEPADLHSILDRMPACRAIVSTGGKSAEQALEVLGTRAIVSTGSKSAEQALEVLGTRAWLAAEADMPACLSSADQSRIPLIRRPSTSRAYPMPLEKKAEAYAELFFLNKL